MPAGKLSAVADQVSAHIGTPGFHRCRVAAGDLQVDVLLVNTSTATMVSTPAAAKVRR